MLFVCPSVRPLAVKLYIVAKRYILQQNCTRKLSYRKDDRAMRSIYRVRQKSNPCRILLFFQQPFRIFLMKLCTYILCAYWHKTAKYCLIILKYDKVI